MIYNNHAIYTMENENTIIESKELSKMTNKEIIEYYNEIKDKKIEILKEIIAINQNEKSITDEQINILKGLV